MASLSESARQLLNLLNAGEELSYADIRQRCGDISERQALRLVKELYAFGARIESRWQARTKRFFIAEPHREYPVRVVALTEEEILALTVAAQATHSSLRPTPLRAPLDSGFAKLRAELRSTPISFDLEAQDHQWHFSEAPSVPIDIDIWRTLRDAIENNQSVRIDYYSASSEKHYADRPIDPYCFAVLNGSWLLVGWCHLRQGIRDFALADISRVTPFDPEKEPRAFFDILHDFDLTAHFRNRFNALAGGDLRTVKLLVEARHARYFKRKTYHASQTIEEERDDGRIVVSYRVAGLDEIRSFAQSWGAGVTVLEPKELIEKMREDARVLAERYGG